MLNPDIEESFKCLFTDQSVVPKLLNVSTTRRARNDASFILCNYNTTKVHIQILMKALMSYIRSVEYNSYIPAFRVIHYLVEKNKDVIN